MDPARVDLVLKYTLAVAGQQDPGRQELGPIHLLKYVYLADLAFAEQHEGATFTAAPWRFYLFGPWAEQVYERISPTMQVMGATERRFSYSRFEGEGIRWFLHDEQMLSSLEGQLPVELALSIKRFVGAYGNDTYGLLHHVYATPPMLWAAPGESLNFSRARTEQAEVRSSATTQQPAQSKSDLRRRRKLMTQLRERVTAKLEQPRRTKSPQTPPRYDGVFFDGVRWLDTLAGPPIEPGEGELEFSEEVWKSRGRGEPSLP